MSMKNYVGDKMLIKELKENELDKSFFTVKFSINVDEILNRRLRYIADQLGITRVELVRDLTTMALSEVEKELGLNHLDMESTYAVDLYEGLENIDIPDMNGKTVMSVPKEEYLNLLKKKAVESDE